MAIALVGSVGAFLKAAANSIQPAFGQSTTAGNLLVAWVAQNADSVNAISTISGGWTQAVQKQASLSAVAVFYKPNCGAAETAPTFNAASANPMFGQLAEFSGPLKSGPVDQTATATATASPMVLTASAADQLSGELQLTASFWTTSNQPFSNITDIYGSNATAISAGNNNNTLDSRHANFGYAITTANNIADTCSAANDNGAGPYIDAEAVLVSFAPGLVLKPGAPTVVLTGYAPLANTPGIPPSLPLVLTGYAPTLINNTVYLTVAGVAQRSFIRYGTLTLKLQTLDFALIDPATIPALGDAVTLVSQGVVNPSWSGTVVAVTKADIVDLASGHKLITVTAKNSSTATVTAAPFNLSDTPNGTTTFGYRGLVVHSTQNTDGSTPTMGNCTVFQPGLGPGMTFNLTSSNLGYSAQAFSIANVTITWGDLEVPIYLIEFGNIPIPLAQAGGGILTRQ